jgi:hypothetical protein
MRQNAKSASGRPINAAKAPRRPKAHADLPSSFEAMVNGWSERDRMARFALAEAHFRQAADLKVLRAFKAYRQKYFA